jgi:translation initiation factor 1A
MVKKNTQGGKAHKKKKNVPKDNESKTTITKVDKKDVDQEYGQVTKLLGNCRIEVNCFDGMSRQCHIRGSMRKKVWIKMNDVVLVSIRDFEPNKGDIIYKYTPGEILFLKKEGEIPDDLKFGDEFEETKDIGFDFDGSSEGDEEIKEEIDIDAI